MRSFALILLAVSFLVSAPNLNAQSASTEPSKSNSPSQPPVPRSGELRGPEKSKAAQEKEQSNPDQRGTEQSPIVVKMAPSQNAQEEAAQAKREKEEKAATERRIEITTYIVAVATAAQAIGLIWTIIVMNRTARRQLRAYVSTKPVDLRGPNPLIFVFSEVNHGQTPAYKVTEAAWIDIFPYPLPPRFHFPALPAPHPGRITIHPKITDYHGEARAVRNFSQQEISAAVSGTQFRMYVYGVISYEDTFEKTHMTQFCYSIQGNPQLRTFFQAQGSGQITPTYEPADQYNKAD